MYVVYLSILLCFIFYMQVVIEYEYIYYYNKIAFLTNCYILTIPWVWYLINMLLLYFKYVMAVSKGHSPYRPSSGGSGRYGLLRADTRSDTKTPI